MTRSTGPSISSSAHETEIHPHTPRDRRAHPSRPDRPFERPGAFAGVLRPHVRRETHWSDHIDPDELGLPGGWPMTSPWPAARGRSAWGMGAFRLPDRLLRVIVGWEGERPLPGSARRARRGYLPLLPWESLLREGIGYMRPNPGLPAFRSHPVAPEAPRRVAVAFAYPVDAKAEDKGFNFRKLLGQVIEAFARDDEDGPAVECHVRRPGTLGTGPARAGLAARDGSVGDLHVSVRLAARAAALGPCVDLAGPAGPFECALFSCRSSRDWGGRPVDAVVFVATGGSGVGAAWLALPKPSRRPGSPGLGGPELEKFLDRVGAGRSSRVCRGRADGLSPAEAARRRGRAGRGSGVVLLQDSSAFLSPSNPEDTGLASRSDSSLGPADDR